MRSSNNPCTCKQLLKRAALASIVVVVGASDSNAAQGWSATALAGIANEQHGGRDWDDSSLAIGLAVDWTFSPSLSLEADFTYVPDIFPDNPTISARLSVVSLGGTILYDLTTGNWQPYIAVGAGFGRTRFMQPQFGFLNDPHWGPAVLAGGGAKRKLTARTEFRADIRYILIRDITDDVIDLWRVGGGITFMIGP